MAHHIHKTQQLKQKAEAASKSLKWVVNQIPEFKEPPICRDERMLNVIRQYCQAGAANIDELVKQLILEPTSYVGKHCSDCRRYEDCRDNRQDPDAINNVEIVRGHCARCFESKDFLQHCKFLVDYIGKPYYRICPKCNKDHNGSCKNCAWASCLTNCGCGTFGFWSDGQYCGEHNHVVEKILTWNEIPTIIREYGQLVFLDRESAEDALTVLRQTYPEDELI